MQDPKVWLRSRKLVNGKSSWDLRWITPDGDTKSRMVGTDRKLAEIERAILTEKLRTGTYRSVRRVTWDEFVADHTSKLSGTANRELAGFILRQFGTVCSPAGPHAATYGMIETYIAFMRDKGNALATQNQHLRYLKAAFRAAIRRSVAGSNPMDGWKWEREDKKHIRVMSADEQTAVLDAAKALYGLRWEAFVIVALGTGARRGELLSLRWENVDFDDETVTFTETKGKRDRTVPLRPEVADVLRRLQIQTLSTGGPFRDKGVNAYRFQWLHIRKRAGVEGVTMQDMRRTYVTRLIRAGVQPDVVQALAGHSSLTTTLRYYTKTTDADKRAAVLKLTSVAV